MPLRALIDGTEYLAPRISARHWAFLRDKVRTHEASLVLPCCRSPGFMRTSRRGSFHFVHKAGSKCPFRHEDSQSLWISTEILRAAAGLDFSGTTDVDVAGIPLPTLITIPDRSHQLAVLGYERKYPLSGIPDLHARLLANKVRACWLLLDRNLDEKDLDSASRGPLLGDIPCFLLKNRGIRVQIPGSSTLPIREFLTALLHGSFHYRVAYRVASPSRISGLLYLMPCPSCGREVYFYSLSDVHYSACGHRLYPVDRDRYRPEILAAFREVMRSRKLPFGHVEWGAGEDKSPESAVLECVHCGKPVYESRIRSFLRRQAPSPVDHFAFDIRWKEPLTVPHPHWCMPSGGEPC